MDFEIYSRISGDSILIIEAIVLRSRAILSASVVIEYCKVYSEPFERLTNLVVNFALNSKAP